MADKQKLRIGGDPKRQTSYNKGGLGINALLGEVGNFFIDANRGMANTSTNVSDFLTSSHSQPLGDTLFGRKGSNFRPAREVERDRRASAILRGNRAVRGNSPARQSEEIGNENQFSSFLSQAENYVPGASDWGALEASLRGRAGEHDAKLAAMYKALQGAIQADAPVIGGIYDEGVSAVDESAQQATQAIMEGYNAARQAQTSSLAALGIEDAAAGLVSDGGGVDFAAQNQGQATERVAETNQTNEDALTKNKAAALNYNTGMGNVAQLEGVESRGQLQNSLTDALSEMAFAQSQESKQRQARIYEVAMQLQQDAQAGLEPDPEMLQALAEFNAEQQQLAFENALSGKKANSNVMLKLLQQTGGDQEKANQIYAEWQAAGIV